MQTYPGLLHFNGNLLVSVDLETTGRRPSYHEIIQIACVPLGPDLKPAQGLMPFYTEIKPNFPERAEQQAKFKHNISMEQLLLHAPSQDKVKDLFVEWFERLDLPFKKGLVPLAHNWAFESSLAERVARHHALRRNLVQPRPRRDAAGHRHQRPGRLPRRGDPLQPGRPGIALPQVQHRQRQRPRRLGRRPGRGGSLSGTVATVLRGGLWVRSGRATTGTS